MNLQLTGKILSKFDSNSSLLLEYGCKKYFSHKPVFFEKTFNQVVNIIVKLNITWVA